MGGRDYETSQFNRATQAKRQPGSLFKLFVYLAAFENGFHPGTTMVDRPVQFGEWEPQNASGRFSGPVSLRVAFAQSINTVAAQLADKIGITSVISVARRMGVRSELPSAPSIALGSGEVTLSEMTQAFAAIAAGMTSVEPYAIQSISSGARQSLEVRPVSRGGRPNELAQKMMQEVLHAVVLEGTGKAAAVRGVPVAGKTGTSQEHRDV